MATRAPPTLHEAALQLSQTILRGWKSHLHALNAQLWTVEPPYALDYSATVAAKRRSTRDDQPQTTEVIWLPCRLSERRLTLKHLDRASEALELLNLLRDLDVALWLTTVQTLWPEPIHGIDVSKLKSARRITIGLAIKLDTQEHFGWISKRVVGTELVSGRYKSAIAELRHALSACNGQTRASYSSHRLMKLADLEAAASSQVLRGSHERTCFQVVELDLDGSALTNMDEDGLAYCRRITGCGVRFTRLLSLAIEGDVKESTTRALHVLIPPEAQSRRHYFGVVEVDILDTASTEVMVPVLSALQASQSVDDVYITMELEPQDLDQNERLFRHKLWRWIAYALFTRHARHSIQNFHVNAQCLSDRDILYFREIVRSKYPLQDLLSSTTCQHYKFITATRFHLERGFGGFVFDAPYPIVVRVIGCPVEETGDWWRVLLPGRGAMFVRHEGVDVSRIVDMEEAFPTIKHLELLNVDEGSKRTWEAFLRALPCHIESITVAALNSSDFVDDWFTPLVNACHGLQKLSISPGCGVGMLEDVVDLAADGKCTLEVLKVGDLVRLRERRRGLLPFLETLADVDHPLSRHLREIELNVSDEASIDPNDHLYGANEELVPKFVSTVEKMLSVNRRLHTVTFIFHHFDEIPLTWPDEQVVIRSPLALRSKLALLSILTSKPVVAIDSAILSIIFQFAAEHRMREVVIL